MKKFALLMALVMLMSLLAAPAYAAEGPSPSRDELESSQPVESEDPNEDIGDDNPPMGENPGDSTDPGEDIGDDNPPMGENPGDSTDPGEDIGDDNPPMGENPGDSTDPGEDIGDDNPPMGEGPVKSPQTSESGMDVVLMTVALICVAGLAVAAVSKKKAVG